MKNGYFQLECSSNGTGLKVFAPKDGGKPVTVREVMEYLNRAGAKYDLHILNNGITESYESQADEYSFKVNDDTILEVRESYTLMISPDKMQASARFYPPSVHGERMTAEEFLRDLEHKGIRFGILKDMIASYFGSPRYCTDFLVARGQPVRHGTDARIEYYFDTDLNTKPTLNEDGSVDFFHLNTVCHCKQGDLLARRFPEDPGDSGTNIYGELSKPREVKRDPLRFGRNVLLSEDKLTLTAETDGHVTLSDGLVAVSNVLELENVDISTGNIEYDGSVKVNGNVVTNFSVKAKGNIEVYGVVEGAYLEAEGDIIIARGVNGMAKGNLKAKGNVVSKFVENAKVSAGGYVSTESILHSEVMAGTEIQVTGRRGFITGGHVSAADLIQVKTLGSPMGTDTIVEVGADPQLKLEYKQLHQQIAEDKRVIESIKPVLTSMAQKLNQGVKFKPEQLQNIKEMVAADKKKRQDLEECMKKMQEIQALLDKSDNARVEVQDRVYAGTRVCIGDVSMVVRDTMHYCKFVKAQGDVKSAGL